MEAIVLNLLKDGTRPSIFERFKKDNIIMGTQKICKDRRVNSHASRRGTLDGVNENENENEHGLQGNEKITKNNTKMKLKFKSNNAQN